MEELDASMEDDDDAAGQGQDEREGMMAEPEGAAEVKTKGDLYRVYGGKGPVAMARAFAEDEHLQLKGILILELTSPLGKEYSDDLKAFQGGEESQLAWSAARAQGRRHWKLTVQNVLDVLQTSGLYRRLRCAVPTGNGAFNRPPDQPDGLIEEKKKIIQDMWLLGLETVSQYICTHVMFSWCLPNCFAVFLLPERERTEEISRVKLLVSSVLKAHEVLAREKNDKLKEAVMDLGWPKCQMAVIMVFLMLQANFSPNDEKCIKLARDLFRSTSTTKDVMESVFAHLRDVSMKQNKNQRLGNVGKWFYATTSAAPEGSHEVFRPSREQFARFLEKAENKSLPQRHLFDMRCTLLPQTHKFEVTPESVQQEKWRPAGPLSHQRSAAAGALLTQLAESNFAAVGDAWAGFSSRIIDVWQGE